MLGKDVVCDSLNTIFLAIVDLIKLGRNIDLAFGFCNIRIVSRGLSVSFKEDLSHSVGNAKFENSMVR